MAAQQTRRWFLPLVGVLTNLLIFYLIFAQVNLSTILEALQQTRYIYVIPAVVLLVARALRRCIDFPLIRAFSIMNIAYLMNALLPFRMGEAARIFLASRGEHPKPVFQTVSSIIVELLLDVLAVLVLLGLALASGPLPKKSRRQASLRRCWSGSPDSSYSPNAS